MSIKCRSYYFFSLFVLLFALSACTGSRPATAPVTEADINNAIDSNKWVFTVSQVMPMYGRTRQANGTYLVSYNGQKLEVYLPYFGRATSGVDVYTGRGPLDFSVENPAVQSQQSKPGEWHLQVKPVNRDVDLMAFTFYANGTASLVIRMSSRSGISYSGWVRPLK